MKALMRNSRRSRCLLRKPTPAAVEQRSGERMNVDKEYAKSRDHLDDNKENDAKDRWMPPSDEVEWDPNLPFGGKVHVAKKRLADPSWIKALEIFGVCMSAVLCYCSYYYIDHIVLHVTRSYARLGHVQAMHQMAERHVLGKGVTKDMNQAVEWFRKAANKGHPEASYNLAVARLKGNVKLEEGWALPLKRPDQIRANSSRRFRQAESLLKYAKENGVQEAHMVHYEECQQRNACG